MTDQFAVFPSGYQQDLNFRFNLHPGDTITECTGIWAIADALADELEKCDACGRRTFRVITITSATNLQKRAALCGKHFILSARAFPQLRPDFVRVA